MRKGYKSAGSKAESGGEQGFWPSYADMMSAIALILFFLMLLAYIQNLITGNNLADTEKMLASTKDEVAAAQLRLQTLSEDLKAKEDEVALKQQELDGYANQILAQAEKMKEQEELISDQKQYLQAADNEIVELRNQMQTIAVFRLSVLEQIKQNIVDVMGDESKVSIGDNGNIILSEGIFFDQGSAELKPEAVTVLSRLAHVFKAFLSDPNNAKYVDSIVISGHTDSSGTVEINRKLATDRASAVVNFLLDPRNGLAEYESFFCPAGYGQTRPVQSNSSAAGMAANRRIEISMILKDDSVLDIVDRYLAIDYPNNQTPQTNG